jgi:REP element-mobilizing transposase RayT
LTRKNAFMGHPPRVIDKNSTYHAGSRGSNRLPIVYNDLDRIDFRKLLARVAESYRWQVLSWCLVDNHYHVVLRTTCPGFSKGFQLLNSSHSRRTNARNERSAHLFKGRPWTRELTSAAYLVGAILYVIRNPVEAGLCRRPQNWPFGSYRALLGLEPAPAWLAVDEVLALFGATPTEARRVLISLVDTGLVPVSDTGL